MSPNSTLSAKEKETDEMHIITYLLSPDNDEFLIKPLTFV